MKKKTLILGILLFFIGLAAFYLFFRSSGQENSSPKEEIASSNSQGGSRISATVNQTTSENRVESLIANEQNSNQTTPPKENQIATFSTVIKDRAAGRLTNIRLTCEALNGTVVQPRRNFFLL